MDKVIKKYLAYNLGKEGARQITVVKIHQNCEEATRTFIHGDDWLQATSET